MLSCVAKNGKMDSRNSHQRLGSYLVPNVAMYAVVYRDPNGTPGNEHDDWYGCVTDKVPAKEFNSLLKSCTAMVDYGSIN